MFCQSRAARASAKTPHFFSDLYDMSEAPTATLETPVEKCRQQMIRLVEDRRFSELRGFCQLWEPFQIARILADLPDEMEAVVFRVLPKRTAAQVFGV